jgi:hypothetical protein
MLERRKHSRLLCSSLGRVTYTDWPGIRKEQWARLEDISRGGICLMVELPLLPGTELSFESESEGRFQGFVRSCELADEEFRLGIELRRLVKSPETAPHAFELCSEHSGG